MAKILVVDDEKEICEITRDFLNRKNYTCLLANTQEQALELVKNEHPQLVMLDVCLGDASGIDVLTRIKELDKNIKVVMVTGLGDEQTLQDAKACGADDFITKPFTASFLVDFLEKKLNFQSS